MSLLTLIQKGGLYRVATATLATQEVRKAGTVAPVATVAVAGLQKQKDPKSVNELEESTSLRLEERLEAADIGVAIDRSTGVDVALEWILKRFFIVPWRCVRCQRRFFHSWDTKLRESEYFRSLIDEAPVMLWMSGTDACCAFFNKPWLYFTELSQREQMEQDWVARIHPEDRERCVNRYLAAFKSRENFTLEYRLVREDGTYRWWLHNGVPRYGADGAFLGYIGTRVDFTDRKDAEEQLRAVSAQLINAQETERYHIGQKLHDDFAQRITAVSIGLTRLSENHRHANLAADYTPSVLPTS